MHSIENATQDDKREPFHFTRLHRRALVTNTTPAQRARYVAESITLRQDAGMAWDWSTYGLEKNADQQALVMLALAALR